MRNPIAFAASEEPPIVLAKDRAVVDAVNPNNLSQ